MWLKKLIIGRGYESWDWTPRTLTSDIIGRYRKALSIMKSIRKLLRQQKGLLPVARKTLRVLKQEGAEGIKLRIRRFDNNPPRIFTGHTGHLSLKKIDYMGYDPYSTIKQRQYLHESGHQNYLIRAQPQPAEHIDAKNILLVSHDMSLSGAPILLFDLAKELKLNGYFVVVISPLVGELRDSYDALNIPVIIDKTIAFGKQVHSQTTHIFALFDVAVVNTVVMAHCVSYLKKVGVPSVLFIHEPEWGLEFVATHSPIKKGLEAADSIIVIGIFGASLYEKYCPPERLKILTPGSKPLEVTDHSSINHNFKILHVGSIEPRKGQDLLLRSLRLLPETYKKNLETHFIGRTLDQQYAENLISGVTTRDKIFFHGQVPRNEMGQYYSQCDVFVCSSFFEVGPLTVLEAMSLGKAILATDVGAVSEMLCHNNSGLIVPSGSSEALARAIMHLYDRPEEIKRLGENARSTYERRYTFNHLWNQFREVIEETIKGTGF